MNSSVKVTKPSIVDFVFQHAQERPDSIAIASEYEEVNYESLKKRVMALARSLTEMGVVKGDIVAVLTPPRTDAYTLFLALNTIGATWLALNNKYKFREMEYIIQDSQPKAFFFISELDGRRYLNEVQALASDNACIQQLCCFDRVVAASELEGVNYFPDLMKADEPRENVDAYHRLETDIAAIIYTSGSTGKPKGCMLPNRSMVYRALLQNEQYSLSDLPRLYMPLPLNHVGGLSLMSAYTMVAGGTLNFRERFDPQEVGNICEQRGINFLMLLPTMYQMIFDAEGFDESQYKGVEIFFWSGACMPKEMIARLKGMGKGQLRSNYGMTEICSSLTCTDPDADIDTLAVTIGYSPTGELRVVDKDGKECGPGQVGEIQVKKEYCMAGYLNNPEATAKTYTDDGWLITGDQVEVMADGKNLRFVGRHSDMYKSGGYNVYPREIEECIEEHPKVSMVAVVGAKDGLYGEVGHAFIVPKSGKELSEMAVKDWCSKVLANYKVPKRFNICSELPLLANGKIDKLTLRQDIANTG